VEIRIDRLVLHGVAPGDRRAVAAAVERELGRIGGEGGFAPGRTPALPPVVLPGRGKPNGGKPPV
jgi:hypothetical protein